MHTSFILPFLAWATLASCVPSSSLHRRSVEASPLLCGNQGLQYAAYPDFQSYEDDDQFDPNAIQHTPPSLGPFVYDGYHYYSSLNVTRKKAKIWNSPTATRVAFLILNEIGYIYAPSTGTYNFSSTWFNDAVFIWMGDIAYSGWNRSNANLYVDLDSVQQQSFTYHMTAGQYYAYRMIYLNKEGLGGFEINIQTPRGQALSTRSLVWRSCDNTTAPPFPDYS